MRTCDCDFSCPHRDKKIEPSSRMRTGSSVQRVWLEIQNPTESDKGKYTLMMFDGTETHERSLDLSGQGVCMCGEGRAGGLIPGSPSILRQMC